MFASKLRIARLTFMARLLSLQIAVFGLKVWLRETAHHALTRYNYRTGLVAYDVNPEDPEFKAAIAAAVEEATAGLKRNNLQLQADLRKAKQGKEIDPAEVERLETELETLRTQLTDANKQLTKATKDLETATATLTAEQKASAKLLIDNGIAAALAAANVTDPKFAKAAAALLREMGPEVKLDGDTRSVLIGGKPLGDVAKEWSQSDDGKAFVTAPTNGGGGAPGSSGAGGPANPWAKDSHSLTEQGRMYKENPSQAKALAAAAGVTLE